MIRIIIADDHAIVRNGLKQILADEAGMELIGEAKDANELLELVRRHSCDVVVLDLSMPGRSGLAVIKELRDGRPHLAVLVLTMHPEDQYAVRALRAGAAGYVTKGSSPAELVKAIKRVAAGGRYITASVAESLAVCLGTREGQLPHENLSDREHEVLCKIASGKTVHQIADELFLSPNTVSTYRTRILEKLQLHGNGELIRYAIKNGLAD
jgi:two-component system, NarL family, invasion response regulator UvrY